MGTARLFSCMSTSGGSSITAGSSISGPDVTTSGGIAGSDNFNGTGGGGIGSCTSSWDDSWLLVHGDSCVFSAGTR